MGDCATVKASIGAAARANSSDNDDDDDAEYFYFGKLPNPDPEDLSPRDVCRDFISLFFRGRAVVVPTVALAGCQQRCASLNNYSGGNGKEAAPRGQIVGGVERERWVEGRRLRVICGGGGGQQDRWRRRVRSIIC